MALGGFTTEDMCAAYAQITEAEWRVDMRVFARPDLPAPPAAPYHFQAMVCEFCRESFCSPRPLPDGIRLHECMRDLDPDALVWRVNIYSRTYGSYHKALACRTCVATAVPARAARQAADRARRAERRLQESVAP